MDWQTNRPMSRMTIPSETAPFQFVLPLAEEEETYKWGDIYSAPETDHVQVGANTQVPQLPQSSLMEEEEYKWSDINDASGQ